MSNSIFNYGNKSYPIVALSDVAALLQAFSVTDASETEFLHKLADLGTKDLELAITNASAYDIATTALSTDAIQNFDGAAGIAILGGETSNDGTDYNHAGKLDFGIMSIQDAITAGLACLGLKTKQDVGYNPTQATAFNQLVDYFAGSHFSVAQGILFGVDGSGKVYLPKPFLQALSDKAAELGLFGEQGDDKPPYNGIINPVLVSSISGWNDFVDYLGNQILNTPSDRGITVTPEIVEAMQDGLRDYPSITQIDFNGQTDIIMCYLSVSTAYPWGVSDPADRFEFVIKVFHDVERFRLNVGGESDPPDSITVANSGYFKTPISGYQEAWSGQNFNRQNEAVNFDFTSFNNFRVDVSRQSYRYVINGDASTSTTEIEAGQTGLCWAAVGGSATYALSSNLVTSEDTTTGAAWDLMEDSVNPSSSDSDLNSLYPDWVTQAVTVSEIAGANLLSFLPAAAYNNGSYFYGVGDVGDVNGNEQAWAQGGLNEFPGGIRSVQQGIQDLVNALLGDNILTVLGDPESVLDWPDGDLDDDNPDMLDPGSGTADIGLVRLYSPSQAQMQAFSRWLWTDSSVLDSIKKYFQSPIEAVVSVSKIYAPPRVLGSDAIVCGYITSDVTGVSTVDQFTTVDCGSLYIPKFFNNILDSNPYTRVRLYLPFVGFVDLDADDVIGATLSVTYGIDVLTGICMARVTVNKTGAQLLYVYEGNCSIQLPISAGNAGSILTASAIKGGASIAAGIAGAITGNVAAIAGAVGGAASTVLGSKASVSSVGSISGNAGVFGAKQPYVVINRPVPAEANNYGHFYGLPANASIMLGACLGYTRARDVILDSIPATGDELEEIDRLLKEGVYI